MQKAVKFTKQPVKKVYGNRQETAVNVYTNSPAPVQVVPPSNLVEDIAPLYNSLGQTINKLSDKFKVEFKKWGKTNGWDSVHNIPIESVESVRLKLTHAFVVDESYNETGKYCGGLHPTFGLKGHDPFDSISYEVFKMPAKQLADLTIARTYALTTHKKYYF